MNTYTFEQFKEELSILWEDSYSSITDMGTRHHPNSRDILSYFYAHLVKELYEKYSQEILSPEILCYKIDIYSSSSNFTLEDLLNNY